MKKKGATMPGRVLSSPSALIVRKFGSAVKIGGTSSAVRKSANTRSRPRQRSRENA